MRTNVASTSIEVYRGIGRSGTLSRQQSIVMAAVQVARDYSLQELVQITGLAINAISGRVSELKASQHLVHADKRKCSLTGHLVRPVRLPEPAQQGVLFS